MKVYLLLGIEIDDQIEKETDYEQIVDVAFRNLIDAEETGIKSVEILKKLP